MEAPQRRDIEYNRVYRRAEFAVRPEPWGSPLPSIEIIGEGSVYVYGSNLPRHVDTELYQPPIEDTLADITDKMTLITDPCPLCAGFHDSCICTIWIAFVWDSDSSVEPPIIRDACLIDHELDWRRRNQGC